MYAVAVRGTVVAASRGNPEKVDISEPESACVEEAREFCREFKVPIDGEPRWWLVSWWG